MDLLSDFEVVHRLIDAVAVGETRVESGRVGNAAIETLLNAIDEQDKAIRKAIDESSAALRDEIPNLIRLTDGLFKTHTLLSIMAGVRRVSDDLREPVENMLREVELLGSLGIPADYLPSEVRDIFASQPDLDVELSTSNLLALADRGPSPESGRAFVAVLALRRLWALHGLVLASVAATEPSSGDTGREELRELRASAEGKVRTLRDRLYNAANDLRRRELAGPAWSTAMWLAVDDSENWIAEHAADMATASGAASVSSASDETRRDVALAYDAVRTLLALAAGGWAVLRAWATEDLGALSRFAEAGKLRRTPGTADPPRSTLTQAAEAAPGTMVEVADVVIDAEITPGGPAPRTVLTIGSERGAQLIVLIPFIAADSFGIEPGIWLQARGEIFPNGKDDLPGAVLQVDRIRREEAAEVSFFDYLIFEGRRQFEFRPGGFDIVAGRLAGSDVTLAELGLRTLGGKSNDQPD
jgi:hypothetical protein